MQNNIRNLLIAGGFIIMLIILGSIPDDEAVAAASSKNTTLRPAITFLEIGSTTCIPCKMMQPVMKEIEGKYKGKVAVIFNDVSGRMGSYIAKKYGINMIPSQVLLDAKGKEFFRHTGFYPASELAKILDKKLGKNVGNI